MSKQYRRLLENQPQVKVAAYVENNTPTKTQFLAFAIALMGFIFFFSNIWHALAGG